MTDEAEKSQTSTVAAMVRAAEEHADSRSADRLRAVGYYNGEMEDTPAEKQRSKMVSRDVRDQIKRALPSLMRTLLGSDSIGEFQPGGPDDEDDAKQATDYINRVVAVEANLRRRIEDALHDALQVRNGVLKWWWEERDVTRTSKHTGLTMDALAQLVEGDEVEVLEQEEYTETTDMGEVQLFDVKIRRTEAKGEVKIASIPRERFLIDPNATSLEESALTGDKMVDLTRSDLIAMGHDVAVINALPVAGEDDAEEDQRRGETTTGEAVHRPNQQIDYYDLFVRYDEDGDGIAELRHMVFAGGLGEKNLLVNEECPEVQFCDIKVMTRPHQWEGISLADDLMDIQRAKTVLLRQTFNNLYWQNNLQPVYQKGAILNPDALFNPEFGKPIQVSQGTDARSAVSFLQVPFVAADSYNMLEYMDREAQDRTGISDASAGLDPDALQNVTATASAMMNQAGVGQVELMVRTAAEGIRTLMRGLLRLTIRHQDIARTVRLNEDWVEVDPRDWNADMDCIVNVGLGAGTRERDMQVMQFVLGLQEKLVAGLGPDNPFVKPENVWQAISRTIEAAGLKTPEMYFTQPDPQEVQAKMQEGQTDPAQAAAQAKMQMEQQKAQADVMLAREKAKMDADLAREKAKADIQLAQARAASEMTLAREKMAMEAELSREKMQLEAATGAHLSRPSAGGSVRPGGAVG